LRAHPLTPGTDLPTLGVMDTTDRRGGGVVVDGIVKADEREAAEAERMARRLALMHGALLSIAALDPAEAHRAPEIARGALERRERRD
jgi:hypothetical protein